MTEWISTQEAAQMAGWVSRTRVNTLIREGAVVGRKAESMVTYPYRKERSRREVWEVNVASLQTYLTAKRLYVRKKPSVPVQHQPDCACRRCNRTYNSGFSFSLETELREALRERASSMGLPEAEIVRTALVLYLEAS